MTRPPAPPHADRRDAADFADTRPVAPTAARARRGWIARAGDALPWVFCATAVAWASHQVVVHRLRPPAASPAASLAAAPPTTAVSMPAPPVLRPPPPPLPVSEALRRLSREDAPAPTAVRTLLTEVLATGDHDGRPFVIVDKRGARVWLFDAQGSAAGTSPVLVGHARGDDSPPGIGEKPLDAIAPHERITPAGRFLAAHGVNTSGEDVVWVDWHAAVSMHRLRPTDPAQRRPQRMASATPADNRITWGCINVPPSFYDGRLLPLVRDTRPVVYVLPETRPLAGLLAELRSAAQARHAQSGRGGEAGAAHPELAPRRDG